MYLKIGQLTIESKLRILEVIHSDLARLRGQIQEWERKGRETNVSLTDLGMMSLKTQYEQQKNEYVRLHHHVRTRHPVRFDRWIKEKRDQEMFEKNRRKSSGGG